MKTVAVLDCFRHDREYCGEFIRDIRETAGADRIIWIALGEFDSDGRPAARSAAEDAKLLRDAGADLVLILPQTAAMDTADTEIFAQIALIGRLHAVDSIAVPVSGRCSGEEIRRLGMFLFQEPRHFQKDVRAKMASGCSMEEAKRICAEACVPGAEAMLMDPLDRAAVELVKCMYQQYCCIKTEWIQAEKIPASSFGSDTLYGSREMDELIVSSLLKMRRDNEKTFLTRAAETAGGSGRIREMVLGLAGSGGSLLSGWQDLHGEEQTELRKYLIRFLAGIRMADNQMCGLHTYCPYAVIGAEASDPDGEWNRMIRERSWTPLFKEEEYDTALITDPGQEIFHRIDSEVRILHERMCRAEAGLCDTGKEPQGA